MQRRRQVGVPSGAFGALGLWRLGAEIQCPQRSERLPPPCFNAPQRGAGTCSSAVSPQRHHKHTEYLVKNADIAGMTDHERALAALVARFHRRSAPERSHPSLATLTAAEFKMVRRASTLLRIADGLDRSRRQPVSKVRVTTTPTMVRAQLESLAPVELELWDVEREAALFQRVFNRRLEVVEKRVRRKV